MLHGSQEHDALRTEHRIVRVVRHHFPSAKLRFLETLSGGVSAKVYRLDLVFADGPDIQIVLRVHGPDHSGHDIELEFQLLRSLHASGLPVPEPIGFDASRQTLDRPYLLMGFVAGTTALSHTAADEYINTLAAVHATPIDSLPELPKRVDPLPELLEFLPAESEWDDFRDHLSKLKNTAFDGPATLLHGDFWPQNLIWRQGRIAAILDWEDATIGDPLSDIACTCLELRYLFGKRGMERFKQTYAKHARLEASRFALWLAYVSAAAQKHMADWGLEPSRESHMRKTALASLSEAASSIMSGSPLILPVAKNS